MKKIALVLLTAFAMAETLFANAGIFDGIGGNLTLTQSAEIQMVSEKIVMTPMRAPFPVDGGARGVDLMRYYCLFKLKNLTDKTVSVQVGFPLQSETIWSEKDKKTYHQADIAARFNFIAGTAKEIYPVRFEAADKDKKFRKLFLWTMTFAPKEEIDLTVTYTMNGYFGMGSLQKPSQDKKTKEYRRPYLASLSGCLVQMFGYVTETGNSWAGEIERAEFELCSAEFEAYLSRRGPLEVNPDQEAKELEQKKKSLHEFAEKLRSEGRLKNDPNYEQDMLEKWKEQRKNGPQKFLAHDFLRILEPETGWKKVEEPRRNPCLKLEYAPFQAGPGLTVKYFFTMIPDTPEKFDAMLDTIRKELEAKAKRKPDAEQYDLESVRKNLADAILEFYGVEIGNKEIRDFLDDQIWYPVKTPPPLSPGLKAYLLNAAGRELPAVPEKGK